MQTRLAPMPKGKVSKTLSNSERLYIDENHMYEPIARMANVLGINFIDVHVYCSSKNYQPAANVKSKPKKAAKSNTFDVDTYRTITI